MNFLDLLEGIFAFSLPICLWIRANDEAPLFLRLWEMQWCIICQGISGGALYFRPQVRIATCLQNMAVAVGIIMASKEAVFVFLMLEIDFWQSSYMLERRKSDWIWMAVLGI